MSTPRTPTGREAIDRALYDLRCTMHTCFPAQVLAYDLDAQVVDLRPALMREVPSDEADVDWGFESLPDLLSVQVMWPRAGSHVLTFPLSPGDWMLVLCAEQTTSRWRSRASAPTEPGVNDAFGLNGCVAFPGWYPDAKRLGGVSGTDLVLGDLENDATVRVKPDGTVVIGGESGAGFVALAALVDARLDAIEAAFNAHVHASLGAIPTPGAGTGYTIPLTGTDVAATKVKAR